ncbi:MAG: hypothetical protein K2X93_06900 [Candidatus Obscuribacterales bacterium]|nr:hypothetical protein [Candidatus Obscuribacterales bacterium]
MESSSFDVGKSILYCGGRGAGKSTCLSLIASIINEESQLEFEEVNVGGMNLLTRQIVVGNPNLVSLSQSPGFDKPITLYEICGDLEENQPLDQLIREIDGIVFVSDSRSTQRLSNLSAMKVLRSEVERQGGALRLATDIGDPVIPGIPIVLQHNKRDLSDCMTLSEMESEMNWSNFASFDSIATEGYGVFATLVAVVRLAVTIVASSTPAGHDND